jgi:Domain of unknown function (DUF397)
MTVDLSRATWRKSSLSAANGCVEVAFVDGQVAVRDSKDRGSPALVFTAHEWAAFIDRARDGEFDQSDDASASKGERPIDSPAGVLKKIDLLDVLRAGGTLSLSWLV